MSADRLNKVYRVLRQEFPTGGGVALSMGISQVSGDGDGLVIFQESSEMLVTDNTRQVRSIGVRIASFSVDEQRSRGNLSRAVAAIEAAETIRVFDISGVATELETELPAPEGMYIASQLVNLR